MKKSMLCAGLMTILSATVSAEDSSNPVNVNAEQMASTPANTQPMQNIQLAAAEGIQTPSPQGVQTPSTTDKNTQTPSTSDQVPNTGTPTPTANAPVSSTNTSAPVTSNSPVTPAGTTAPASGTPAPASSPMAPASINPAPASGTPAPASGTPAPASGTPTPASGTPAPASGTPAPASGTPAPASSTPAPAANPLAPGAGGSSPTAPAAATPPQPLNCNYRIPADTAHIEQTIIMKWAEKAAEQSFDFDHASIDQQLTELKSCYTDQGWQGFNDALQKSGNLNAIKSQKLMVSSMVNGESKVIEIKDNQWKVIIPMQVVYQNDKEKLTQPLTVNLVVGRKISGDLGILQMIAVPSQTNSPLSDVPANPAGQ